MRKLTIQEKELWAKLCATIDGRKRSRVKYPINLPITINQCLDLHGHNEDSAYSTISQFLALNYQQNSKQVTIITGKGKSGVGILRRLVPYWLETTLSIYVRSYNFDSKNTGQLIINLKKHSQ